MCMQAVLLFPLCACMNSPPFSVFKFPAPPLSVFLPFPFTFFSILCPTSLIQCKNITVTLTFFVRKILPVVKRLHMQFVTHGMVHHSA